MFGLGKIFSALKFIAPIVSLVTPLGTLSALFKYAETFSNLVSTFKRGFSFLDLVSKFAPMPKLFDFNSGQMGCFNFLNSSKVNSWQNVLANSNKANAMFDIVKGFSKDTYQINSARTTAQYSFYA